MPISDYLRKKNIMDLVNSISTSGGYPTTYIALSSTPPNADGTGVTEPSGNGYRRISTKWVNLRNPGENYTSAWPSEPSYDAVNDKYSVTNTEDIYWFEATGSWGTLGYFALYDAETGGNLYAYGTLSNAIAPTAGTIPVIRAGDITIVEQ